MTCFLLVILPLFLFTLSNGEALIFPTGKWNYLGIADKVEFSVGPSDHLLLLEFKVRSRAVKRFVLETSEDSVPSVKRYHDGKDLTAASQPFPTAAMVLQPKFNTHLRVDTGGFLAPLYVRLTEIKTFGPVHTGHLQNLILIRTKIPHFLQDSVCELFGAKPVVVRCRNYNSVVRFLQQALGANTSVSIGMLDKSSSKSDKLIQIDIDSDGYDRVRYYKSRGTIVKRKMVLCELVNNDSTGHIAKSTDVECHSDDLIKHKEP